MGRPDQRTGCASRLDRSSCHGPIEVLGLSFLLLLPGCAQFDRLMGKVKGDGFGTADSAPSAHEQGKSQTQRTEPVTKPVAKTSERPQPAKPETESHPQPPEAAPSQPAEPATAASKEPETEITKPEPDKTVVEKDQTPHEKKAHVAPAKKSKKQATPKPPTEDAFLPPVPPPSKPPAIGGSGG